MNENKNIMCVQHIYKHTCAHPLIDYFHGLVHVFTIQQLDKKIQIDQNEGSSDTFEVLVLHMPLHRHSLLFHDQSKKIPTMCNV